MHLCSHVQVWFLQRRFHKDILLNPVLMLSFCPDLSAMPGHLGTATRELLFLLDGSSAAHKACGGAVWAGLGWVGRRAEVGCSLRAPTHSLSPHTQTFSPRVQEPLSYVQLHSDTPNPKAKCHSHTQSPSHSQVLTPRVFLRKSLTHRASPRLAHPRPRFTRDLEKARNLLSLTLYPSPWDLPHAALPPPPQDAIVLAVKSLPSQTLVNLAMFGTSVQPLFPESRLCSDVSGVQDLGV